MMDFCSLCLSFPTLTAQVSMRRLVDMLLYMHSLYLLLLVFHDVRSLVPNLDFVNLWAFDYYTPERNPKEADYPAPLHELIDRKLDENGNHLVQYWLGIFYN